MLLEIPLDIPDVEIEKVTRTSNHGFEITVSSTLKGGKCRQCGKVTEHFYGYGNEITLRHLPLFEMPVWIKIRPKRYQCFSCTHHPTSVQACSWYDRKSPHTRAYEQWLLRDLINSTITDVSMKRGIGEAAVEGILNRYISQQIDWQRIEAIPILGIDEIALKKGHQDFVVIISAINTQGDKHILAVLPDRKKDTVKTFLATIPTAQKVTILHVCVDMYQGYRNAVKEELPKAVVIVDRFHIAKNYRAGADKARKDIMHKLKKDLPATDYAKLKGVLWAFRTPLHNLTEQQQAPLFRLFHHAPLLKEIYLQREVLTGIFNSPLTKTQAIAALDAWVTRVQTLKLTCFDAFIETLQNWKDEITNYFIQRQSSGFVEGLNNKIKVIKRRCYGIYNIGRLFQSIWLDVEGRRLFGYA